MISAAVPIAVALSTSTASTPMRRFIPSMPRSNRYLAGDHWNLCGHAAIATSIRRRDWIHRLHEQKLRGLTLRTAGTVFVGLARSCARTQVRALSMRLRKARTTRGGEGRMPVSSHVGLRLDQAAVDPIAHWNAYRPRHANGRLGDADRRHQHSPSASDATKRNMESRLRRIRIRGRLARLSSPTA